MRHVTFAALVAACGPTAKNVEPAGSASIANSARPPVHADVSYGGSYDTIFATTLDVVAKRYRVSPEPTKQRMETPWIGVRVGETEAGPNRLPGSNRPTKSFIRFTIEIAGGPPWRVLVRGGGSTWDAGAAQPYVFTAGNQPAWVATYTESLVRAIHERLAACCR